MDDDGDTESNRVLGPGGARKKDDFFSLSLFLPYLVASPQPYYNAPENLWANLTHSAVDAVDIGRYQKAISLKRQVLPNTPSWFPVCLFIICAHNHYLAGMYSLLYTYLPAITSWLDGRCPCLYRMSEHIYPSSIIVHVVYRPHLSV